MANYLTADIGDLYITQYTNNESSPILCSYICQHMNCHKINYNVRIGITELHRDKNIIKYCRYCGKPHKLLARSYTIDIRNG